MKTFIEWLSYVSQINTVPISEQLKEKSYSERIAEIYKYRTAFTRA